MDEYAFTDVSKTQRNTKKIFIGIVACFIALAVILITVCIVVFTRKDQSLSDTTLDKSKSDPTTTKTTQKQPQEATATKVEEKLKEGEDKEEEKIKDEKPKEGEGDEDKNFNARYDHIFQNLEQTGKFKDFLNKRKVIENELEKAVNDKSVTEDGVETALEFNINLLFFWLDNGNISDRFDKTKEFFLFTIFISRHGEIRSKCKFSIFA